MKSNKGFYRPIAVWALICSLIIAPMHSAYAASTDIADVPMAVKNQVASNIMFTLDDSGSMHWEFIPEENMWYSQFLHPRPSSPYGGADYTNQVPNFDDGNLHNFFGRSAANNKLYYNPDINYKPWSNHDGSLMPNASPTAVYYNPARTSVGTIDLTAEQTKWAIWFSDDGTGLISSAVCDPNPNCGADHTFWPITYFNYGGAGSRTLRSNYTKVEITSSTPSSATFTSPNGTVRTKAQEVQNFANWFQYYRSRILAARAGIGRAFSSLGTKPRVGFAAINKGSTTVDGSSHDTVIAGVRPFTGTDRQNFFTELYGHVIPTSNTPLRKAMDDVGQYFSRTDNRGPWGETPGSTGGTQHSCRANYHVLMTDGYWNGSGAPTADATDNVDDTNGSVINGFDSNGVAVSYQYIAGNPFSDSYDDTLADVAMYYWNRDLRSNLTNNVPANVADPAFWQHVTTFTVSLGLEGTIPASTINDALDGTGTPPTITWPDPNAASAHKIDDLAHAAVNGHGGFFSAADPETFAGALTSTLESISARDGAAAAVAVSNPNVVAGDNSSFASSYNSGTWTGDLDSFSIDLTTGAPSTTSIWASSAQTQLDLRTSASRRIVSYTGNAGIDQGIQFQPSAATTPTKLSSAQETQLASPVTPPGPADGAAVLAYLRGDRSGEALGTYRARSHLLGDIINAEPVVVREPTAQYGDAGYSAYKTAQASRTKIVLQGANDGMLHAFNAGTGREEWAYVPNLLMGSLNNLSKKTGFSHKYYVDGTPFVSDVDFNNTDGASAGGQDWKTIAVGGLGKGGFGFYALDLTSTTAASEAALTSKVLWEFPNSGTNAIVKKNIGYSFGKPIIAKTRAAGWVVLVTSGYNNGTNTGDSGGDGEGYLFVLNARTGELIKAIGTGAGTPSTPSGFAHITGYAEADNFDRTVEYVYGGDLEGNVWRFDLTHATNINQWSVRKLATLVDGSGTPAAQPITSPPELSKVTQNGVDYRTVYVGTGRYLGDTDVTTTQRQTMYALVDDLSNAPLIDPLRSQLLEQTLTNSATGQRVVAANAITIDYTSHKGWFVDLPANGERANTAPALAAGALVFTTNIPSTDPCLPGGSSWLNVLDYATGGTLTNSTVTWSSVFIGNALASRVVLIKLPSGGIKALSRTSTGQTKTLATGIPPSASGAVKRKSWIELQQ